MKTSVYEKAYTESPNVDYLHIKRMQIYQEMVLLKMKDPDFSMSTLEYMEINCPNEKELIELEKIRVAENEKIFKEWKDSDSRLSFVEYAHREYNFNDPDDLSKISTPEKTL